MKDEKENRCYKEGEKSFKSGGSKDFCNLLDEIQDSQGTSVNNTMKIFNINVPNYRERVMEHIEEIVNSIENYFIKI